MEYKPPFSINDNIINLLAKVSELVGQVSDQETDQVKTLLSCPGDDIISAAQLMERLGLSHRPTFRKNYLHPALKAGLIEITIPEKPNSRNQKYRKAEK